MRPLTSLPVLLVVFAIILSACGQAVAVPNSPAPSDDERPSPTEQPSASPRPSPSERPTENPAPTPTPTPEPSLQPVPPPTGSPVAYRFGDEVRVTVDDLAVRRFPLTSSPLVVAMVHDSDTGDRVPAGDVRLAAGHHLWIDLGPIILDGIAWYQVHTGMQPGETEVVTWDADGDGDGSDNGWIAAGIGGDAYLEFVPRNPAEPVANPPLVEAGGIGSFTSQPFRASFQVGGQYALGTNGVAPCDLRVTLRPTGEVLVDTSLRGAFEGGEFDSSATDVLPDGEYTLEIVAGVPGNPDAGCPWSLVLFQNIG